MLYNFGDTLQLHRYNILMYYIIKIYFIVTILIFFTDESCSANEDLDDTNKISNEENVLPLELVINKDAKSKENYYNLASAEHRSSSNHCHENGTFNDNKRTYKSITDDMISNNDSGKLYIPKIEPADVVLNIHAQLINKNDQNDSGSSPNQLVRKYRLIVDIIYINIFIAIIIFFIIIRLIKSYKFLIRCES